ncbi:MAG: hypothetical protein FWF75_03525 [Propionibacteriaceae bacterium]|nr:hypothetical protein [Propionibacteriaceae bacterium]
MGIGIVACNVATIIMRPQDGASPRGLMIIAATVFLWWMAMKTVDPHTRAMSRYPHLQTSWIVVYCLFLPFNIALLLIGIHGLPVSVMVGGLAIMIGAVVVMGALAVPAIRARFRTTDAARPIPRR